jgi:antitoxin VapB
MDTAKLFTNGRSQAVRLPKECRFPGEEVYIKRYQGIVMLLPKDSAWISLIDSLAHFSEDFMATRDQPTEQVREPV